MDVTLYSYIGYARICWLYAWISAPLVEMFCSNVPFPGPLIWLCCLRLGEVSVFVDSVADKIPASAEMFAGFDRMR
jgi:hypothetical protein